jgi:hypothetical protein
MHHSCLLRFKMTENSNEVGALMLILDRREEEGDPPSGRGRFGGGGGERSNKTSRQGSDDSRGPWVSDVSTRLD